MQYVYDTYDEILYTFNDNVTLSKIYETVDKNTFLKTETYFNYSSRLIQTRSSEYMMDCLITKLSAANSIHSAQSLNSMRNINIAMKELLDTIDKFIAENENEKGY